MILKFKPFLFSALFASGISFGQTVGDLNHFSMTMSYTHDSTFCATSVIVGHNVNIMNSFVGDSIKAIDFMGQTMFSSENTTGASPWNVFVPITDVGMINDINASGGVVTGVIPSMIYKLISGPDTLYLGPHFFSEPIPDLCAYSTVTGQVYIDNNANCSYSVADSAITSLWLAPSINFINTPYSGYNSGYTDGSGNYTITMQESWMIDYTVAVPTIYQFIFPNGVCTPLTYNFTTLPQTGVDFVLECADVDTYVNGNAASNVHAALPFHFYAAASNIGCDQISGTLKLVLDPNVTYNAGGSPNPADYVDGDTLFWDYVNLNNIAGGAYWNSLVGGVELMPNVGVVTGDVLCFELITGVPGNDIDPTNNTETVCVPVVAAYDPNIKKVLPAGTGAEGFIPASTPKLNYTIHFQNTGTADAINVFIIDTLESNLLPETFHIIGSSHTMTPEWLSSNVIRFNFNNIYLPDSNTNEPASHGFVEFEIAMEQGLAEGTEIKNRADIYFDFNPAVTTGYALNTIEFTSGITENENSEFTLYPNPTSGICNIQISEKIERVEFVDLNGRVLITTTSNTADLSDLPTGIYFVKVYTENGVTTKKIVKK